MDINFYHLHQLNPEEKQKLLRRSELDITQFQSTVEPILEEVRQSGDQAIVKYARQFDRADLQVSQIRVTEEEFRNAEKTIDPAIKQAIEYSAKNVIRFHQAQMPSRLWLTDLGPGITAGQQIQPIPSVGLYVPRGKGAFPSVMYMLAAPAVVAGVKKVIVCTPSTPEGEVDDASLVAARVCGIQEVYKVGGAVAIAAMAYGTETVPKVDKIVGPGNSYTSAAKRILFGKVDVGLPAGPSESIILADASANPTLVAKDLLIEAEHGPDSGSILVTCSEPLAKAVLQQLPALIDQLPPQCQAFCQTGFSQYGGIVVTRTLGEAIAFTNDYAPEHMQLMVREPFAVLPQIKNAGEILIGDHTPTTLANFSIGPNAILPTGGFAKTYSGVSVWDFLKRTSVAYVTREGYDQLAPIAGALAEYEGFSAHANAVKGRYPS